MKWILAACLFAVAGLRADEAIKPQDPRTALSEAWHSPDARASLGELLFSDYECQAGPPEETEEGQARLQDFSDSLDDFLQDTGPASDCALVHALWFDLGDDALESIQGEIEDRGERMLPVLAYSLQELAQQRRDLPEDCGWPPLLKDAEIQDMIQDCVKGIKKDITNQRI